MAIKKCIGPNCFYTIRDADFSKIVAVVKSILSNRFQIVRIAEVDCLQTGTRLKSGITNACYTGRNGNRVKTVTCLKSMRSNGSHTILNHDSANLFICPEPWSVPFCRIICHCTSAGNRQRIITIIILGQCPSSIIAAGAACRILRRKCRHRQYCNDHTNCKQQAYQTFWFHKVFLLCLILPKNKTQHPAKQKSAAPAFGLAQRSAFCTLWNRLLWCCPLWGGAVFESAVGCPFRAL